MTLTVVCRLQTGYLISLKAALILLLLAAILPATDYILTKIFSFRSLTKDLHIARVSCLLLLAGNVLIGLAVTDAIMLLGKCIHPSITVKPSSMFPEHNEQF